MSTCTDMPAKIIHESIGHTVSVETRCGDVYRGHLMSVEDNFNCMLEGVTVMQSCGTLTVMEQTYVRGHQV